MTWDIGIGTQDTRDLCLPRILVAGPESGTDVPRVYEHQSCGAADEVEKAIGDNMPEPRIQELDSLAKTDIGSLSFTRYRG